MTGAVQLALFPTEQPSRYPHSPGFKALGASQEAARRIAGDASRLRSQVLAELRNWPAGRTADELARLLGRDRLSIRPRLSELRAAGNVVATGERRKNDTGLTATVWRIAP
jgi:predicted ArsR family transcriptional regulator